MINASVFHLFDNMQGPSLDQEGEQFRIDRASQQFK
jgi:hypothetical protein